MGNPQIVWDGNVLDFPDQINRYEPEINVDRVVERALSGRSETAVFRKDEEVRVSLIAHTTLAFHRELQAWWAWVSEGNPFAFAFDREARTDLNVNGVGASPELITTPFMDDWAGENDLNNWTEDGGTDGAINRRESATFIYTSNLSGQIRMSTDATAVYLEQAGISLAVERYRVSVRWKLLDAATGSVRFAVDRANNYWNGTDWTGAISDSISQDLALATVGEWTVTEFDIEVDSATTHDIRVMFATAVTSGTRFVIDAVSLRLVPDLQVTNAYGLSDAPPFPLRIRQASGLRDEVVTVVSSSNINVQFQDPLRFTYAAGDSLRSVDYYPALEVTNSDQPFSEDPGLLYTLDLKAIEYRTT